MDEFNFKLILDKFILKLKRVKKTINKKGS